MPGGFSTLLRPYLKEERQEKIERALQLARSVPDWAQVFIGMGGMRDVQPLYSRGSGAYTRIPEEEHRTSPVPPGSTQPRQEPPTTTRRSIAAQTITTRVSDGLTGMLRHFLDQLHLDHVDTGDLLLLGLLFFLFREDADEELLVSLGLLLIL